MYGVVLTLHLLGATIWTGGHLVLAMAILPSALRRRAVDQLLQFEQAYEKVGMPALLLQVVTGVWLALQLQPDVHEWFRFDSPVSRLIGTKLLLLAITAAIAADTRLRIVPRLTAALLPTMAVRISLVTLLSIGFVVVGASLRSGLLS